MLFCCEVSLHGMHNAFNQKNIGGLVKNIPVKMYRCYDILDINAEETFPPLVYH